jgi:hypothetical protein
LERSKEWADSVKFVFNISKTLFESESNKKLDVARVVEDVREARKKRSPTTKFVMTTSAVVYLALGNVALDIADDSDANRAKIA